MSDIRLFTLRLPIRFTHTDPAGQVFFPRYFEMFQATVEDWFTHGLGFRYAGLIADGFGLPTAQTECEFFRPSRLGEAIDLTVYLTRIGRSSMTIEYVGRVEGERRFHGKSILVLIRLSEGKSAPFPPDMRRALEAYARIASTPDLA